MADQHANITDNLLGNEFGFPQVGGLLIPDFPTYKNRGAKLQLEDIKTFESRDTDILLCTFPKSGTHWIDETIKMITSKEATYGIATKMITMMDIMEVSVLDTLPSPRILNTHMPFRHLPQKHIREGYKVVHVIRNPKDVCVSYFNHLSKEKFVVRTGYPGTWNNFVNIFCENKMQYYDGWFNYERGFEEAKKSGKLINVHTLFYEDMKKNPVSEIKKLSTFCGYECDDVLAAAIADKCSFEKHAKHAETLSSSQIIKLNSTDGSNFIFRKGTIGDWKNWFTVAQNEQFDAAIEREMKDSQLKFTYEF